jgi:hypothetical protein
VWLNEAPEIMRYHTVEPLLIHQHQGGEDRRKHYKGVIRSNVLRRRILPQTAQAECNGGISKAYCAICGRMASDKARWNGGRWRCMIFAAMQQDRVQDPLGGWC